MKTLTKLLLLSCILISCEKEVLSPEKSGGFPFVGGTGIVECFFFFDSDNVDGTIDFYKGQQLDQTRAFRKSDLRDTTLFNQNSTISYIRFVKLMTLEEVVGVEGWCYVNIHLNEVAGNIMNVNYYSRAMTFSNNNLHLLEPSTKSVSNTNELYNSFWINYFNPHTISEVE